MEIVKTAAICLLGWLLLCQDEGVPDSWIDLMAAASSIDPDEREAARAALEKATAPQRDTLKKLAKSDDRALVIAGLIGDSAARPSDLIRLLKSRDVGLRRGAAEALAHDAGGNAIAELAACLAEADLGVALAATRALAQIRSASSVRAIQKARGSKDRRTALLGACGMELLNPGSETAYIVARLSGEDGYAIGLNSPSVVDHLWRSIDKQQGKRDRKLRDRFEGDDMTAAEREMLGLLCLKAAIFDPVDVFEYLRWPASKPRAWALRLLPRLRSLHKSTLAYDLVKAIETRASTGMSDEQEQAHYEMLEDLLVKACGVKKPEGEFDARATEYRAWYDRVWSGLVDSDADRAIERGVGWLRSHQQKDGSWQWCLCGKRAGGDQAEVGVTSLCGYTLMKMGVAASDPAVESAAGFVLKKQLRDIPQHRTYSVSLEAMFLSEFVAKPKKQERGTRAGSPLAGATLKRIQECVDWLVEARAVANRQGARACRWSYQEAQGEGGDNSNTQFAVLGLLAGQNAGAKVPPAVWQEILNYWTAEQLEDGGWFYGSKPPADQKAKPTGSASMTGAGICCVLIAEASFKKMTTEKVRQEEEIIKRALAKWGKAYPIDAPARYSEGHVFSKFYDLYSIERAMMLGGVTTLGERDWYHDGALYILWNQSHEGAWIDTTDTCFALLFLKRAFVPVVVTGGR